MTLKSITNFRLDNVKLTFEERERQSILKIITSGEKRF